MKEKQSKQRQGKWGVGNIFCSYEKEDNQQ
jgi:hypothetical protein